jgi:hypothetical protein
MLEGMNGPKREVASNTTPQFASAESGSRVASERDSTSGNLEPSRLDVSTISIITHPSREMATDMIYPMEYPFYKENKDCTLARLKEVIHAASFSEELYSLDVTFSMALAANLDNNVVQAAFEWFHHKQTMQAKIGIDDPNEQAEWPDWIREDIPKRRTPNDEQEIIQKILYQAISKSRSRESMTIALDFALTAGLGGRSCISAARQTIGQLPFRAPIDEREGPPERRNRQVFDDPADRRLDERLVRNEQAMKDPSGCSARPPGEMAYSTQEGLHHLEAKKHLQWAMLASDPTRPDLHETWSHQGTRDPVTDYRVHASQVATDRDMTKRILRYRLAMESNFRAGLQSLSCDFHIDDKLDTVTMYAVRSPPRPTQVDSMQQQTGVPSPGTWQGSLRRNLFKTDNSIEDTRPQPSEPTDSRRYRSQRSGTQQVRGSSEHGSDVSNADALRQPSSDAEMMEPRGDHQAELPAHLPIAYPKGAATIGSKASPPLCTVSTANQGEVSGRGLNGASHRGDGFLPTCPVNGPQDHRNLDGHHCLPGDSPPSELRYMLPPELPPIARPPVAVYDRVQPNAALHGNDRQDPTRGQICFGDGGSGRPVAAPVPCGPHMQTGVDEARARAEAMRASADGQRNPACAPPQAAAPDPNHHPHHNPNPRSSRARGSSSDSTRKAARENQIYSGRCDEIMKGLNAMQSERDAAICREREASERMRYLSMNAERNQGILRDEATAEREENASFKLESTRMIKRSKASLTHFVLN